MKTNKTVEHDKREEWLLALFKNKPLTTEEAALYVGCSLKALQKKVLDKKISSYKSRDGLRYFKRSELDDYAFYETTAANYKLEQQADQMLAAH